MKKFNFKVKRPMEGAGAESFAEGDTRSLSATDAAHLVRSGALEPKGKEATAAMEELLGPSDNWGVQRTMTTDPEALRAAAEPVVEPAAGKDAGPAPANKADTEAAAPAAGKDAGPAPANKADTEAAAPAVDLTRAGPTDAVAGAAPAAPVTTAATGKPAAAKTKSAPAARKGGSGRRR